MEAQDVIAYREGARLLREGRFLDALEKFRLAATTGEDRPLEHYAVGYTLVKLGRQPEARAELERFLAMGGADEQQNAFAREMLDRLPAEPEPGAETDTGANEAVDQVRKHFATAQSALEARDYGRALELLEGLRAQMPESEEILNNIGICHFRQGTLNEAVASYRAALKARPGYAPALVNLGRGLLRQAQEAALEAFRKALETDPENVAALVNMGHVQQQLGRAAAARHAFEKAHALAPEDAEIERALDALR